jgi:hypothetical protein
MEAQEKSVAQIFNLLYRRIAFGRASLRLKCWSLPRLADCKSAIQQSATLRYFPQHCLYFFPLLQGHGSLRPTFGPERTGFALSAAAAASLTMSLFWPGFEPRSPGCESEPVVAPPNALVD